MHSGGGRRLRVLMVHHSRALGGAEVSLRTFLERASACDYGLASPAPFPEVAVRHFPVSLPETYRGLRAVTQLPRLARAIFALQDATRRFRPDVIVANAWLSLPAALLVAGRSRAACVWWAREAPGPGARRLARRCARIVVASRRMEQRVGRRVDVADRAKVTVIPSPIDQERYRRPPDEVDRSRLRTKLGLPADGVYVLLVAQYVAWKRHLDLVRAFPAIRERHPRARLLVVGTAWTGADRAYARELERTVWRTIPRGYAFLRPPITDVQHYYWASDLLVLPSRDEPFGRVALEALTAGTPALVSEDAGVAELVADVARELTFRPGDPAALASAVDRVLATPEPQRAEWIRRGGGLVAERCAAPAIVLEIERTLRKAVNR